MKKLFKTIPVDLIDDPAKPLRSDLSPESVADLVLSIKQVGIIEPLAVKPNGERFEVIAGHRRLVAATLADLVELPCYVFEASSEEVEVLKMHENLYRLDISPVDQADHFNWLIKQYKLTPAKIAGLIGKSESYVADRLAILNYPPRLREALERGEIKFSVAREFARMEDLSKMLEYLHYAIKNGLTPTLAKQWVADWKRSLEQPAINPNTAPHSDPDTPNVENFSTCIYCKEKIKLMEANTVYIHDNCLSLVNKN